MTGVYLLQEEKSFFLECCWRSCSQYSNWTNHWTMGKFYESRGLWRNCRHRVPAISELPSFIIDQMYIDGAYHHPTFLYESLWNIGVLIILLLVSRNRMFFGQIFLIYVSLYSVGRFWIEGLRTDSLMLTANLRMAQVLSIVLLIGSILT